MAEFYNVYNQNYLNICKQSSKLVKIKLELLDWNEQTIGDITTNIINTSGNININYQQGTRRTCSFSVVDKKVIYLPSENSPFWYKRKFKIYVGIAYDKDIYYWSQGVFLIQSVSVNGYTLNIEGVDKFGLFDGTLNTMMADVNYNALAKDGNTIYSLIQDTLLLDMGNGLPIDCTTPIIDFDYFGKLLQADVTLDAGNYVGELFIETANFYGVNIYYDTDGHLIFHKMFGDNLPSAYKNIAPQWNFTDNNCAFISQNNNYQFDGHNRVMVYTNSNNSINYSYTAMNTNPASPLNISAVGTRSLDDVEIILTSDMSNDNCRQYAEYLLLKECRMTVNSEITCDIIPHLDVDKTIGVTNKEFNYNSELFIINSITLPLGNANMSISTTNIQCLPDFTCNVII